MAEAGADVHRAVGWPMYEFEGNELIARELERSQAGPVAEVNATDLAVPESRVENHGGAKVRDAVRRVQSPHPTTVMQPRGLRGLRPQPLDTTGPCKNAEGAAKEGVLGCLTS